MDHLSAVSSICALMTIVDTSIPITISTTANPNAKISFVLWKYFETPSSEITINVDQGPLFSYERDLRFFNRMKPSQYLNSIDRTHLLAANVIDKYTDTIKLIHSENAGKALMIVVTDEIYTESFHEYWPLVGPSSPPAFCKRWYDFLEDAYSVSDMITIFNAMFKVKANVEIVIVNSVEVLQGGS